MKFKKLTIRLILSPIPHSMCETVINNLKQLMQLDTDYYE